MSGISSKAASTLTNKYKYNGKEEQSNEFIDGIGLGWTDYGARMYDAQVGRWGAIDPMSEKYMDASCYHYCGNNPISNLDVNGMYFTAAATEFVNKLISNMDKRLNDINNDIAKQLGIVAQAKNEKAKNKQQNKLNDLIKNKDDLSQKFADVKTEIDELNVSTQGYNVTINSFAMSESDDLGNKSYTGATYYNKDDGLVTIILPDDRLNLFAHELKHASQFERGEISLGYSLNWEGLGFLYDKTDEVEGYKRQGLFGHINKGEDTKAGLPPRYYSYNSGPVTIGNHSKVQAASGNVDALKKVSKYYNSSFRINKTTYAE